MHGNDLQADHAGQRSPEHRVFKELPVEGRAALDARVEHIEELEQHEGGERQGWGLLCHAGLQAEVQNRKRSYHHGDAVGNHLPQAVERQQRRAPAARRLVHDARARGVERERHSGRSIHDDRDPENLHRCKWLGQAQQRRKEYGQDGAYGGGQLEAHELHDVVVECASLPYRADQRREVVIEQDHGGGGLGNRRAAAHGNANVGAF